jgi:ABC-type transporter MlaC component
MLAGSIRSATNRSLILGLIVLALFTFDSNAIAESPKQQLQGPIDRVIEVLQTIRSPHDINKNRNALRQLLLTRFDFAAMAQQSLGNRWRELNGKEEEFVSALHRFCWKRGI